MPSRRCLKSHTSVPVTGDQIIDKHVFCPGCGRWTAIAETQPIAGQRMAKLARHNPPTETLAAVRNEIVIRYSRSAISDATRIAGEVFRALTERKLAAQSGTPWDRVDSISVREGDGIRVVPSDLEDEVATIEREIIAASSR